MKCIHPNIFEKHLLVIMTSSKGISCIIQKNDKWKTQLVCLTQWAMIIHHNFLIEQEN